eukprot:scaffold91676_cov69-Phaeocystis_antarctica.AAC.2
MTKNHAAPSTAGRPLTTSTGTACPCWLRPPHEAKRNCAANPTRALSCSPRKLCVARGAASAWYARAPSIPPAPVALRRRSPLATEEARPHPR